MARKKKEVIWEGKWFDDECDVDNTDFRQDTSRCTEANRTKRQRLAQHEPSGENRVARDN